MNARRMAQRTFPHSPLLHTHVRITVVQVCSKTIYRLYTLFNCTRTWRIMDTFALQRRQFRPVIFLWARADGDNYITSMNVPPAGRRPVSGRQSHCTASGVVYERKGLTKWQYTHLKLRTFMFPPPFTIPNHRVCLEQNRWAHQVARMICLEDAGRDSTPFCNPAKEPK